MVVMSIFNSVYVSLYIMCNPGFIPGLLNYVVYDVKTRIIFL